MLKLSPRMQMAADMVRPDSVVCDVGTDHAYLPSYLILNGICPSALACDIGKGPLENARKSTVAYGIADKITLRLSDGLDEVEPFEAQDIVICGMGGTLMTRIIERAGWLRDAGKHLVLQPMTHVEDVRSFLIENGFEILQEKTCLDDGRIYAAISARYSGENKAYGAGFPYYGRLIIGKTSADKAYVIKQYERVIKRRDSIAALERHADEYAKLCEVAQDFEEALKNADGFGDL